MRAISDANLGHAAAYGDDWYTARAVARFRDVFGESAQIFFVFNGTGANVLALSAALRPYEAVLCSEHAHIHLDECGAPERFTGSKLIPLSAPDGKLTPAVIAASLQAAPSSHHVRPRVVSISQVTEFGTVYSVDEVRSLSRVAHEHGLLLHVDGSRLANAAAALGVGLAALTSEAGVDILSFGGTKNGALAAEAVVIFDRALAIDFEYRRKQAAQLASKMRFIAAQLDALLTDELWRTNAMHANAMAQRFAEGLRTLRGVRITQPVDANAIFAELPREVVPALRETYPFHIWNEARSEARLMTSFDTSEEDVDGFLRELRRLLG